MVALPNSAIQYVGSVQYAAVTQWVTLTVKAAGVLLRPFTAPALGSERIYVSTTGGTTGVSEPAWTFGKGDIQPTDGSVVWQECTGQPGVNGDTTNSPVWLATRTVVLGQIIYDSGTASLQIANQAFTTAGTTPTFSATAGVLSTGQDVGKWTSLGLASAFAAFAAPHQRILNADAATWQTVVPARLFIASNHAETQSSAMVLAGGQGTNAAQNQYLCVSSAAAPPTVCTTGATVSTTGASTLSINGFGYYNGFAFQSGSSSSTANIQLAGSQAGANWSVLENCTFKINNTSSSSNILAGPNGGTVASCACTVINPTYIFGATGQAFELQSTAFVSIGGTFAATGSVPTTAFKGVNFSGVGNAIFRGLDISAVTGNLCNISGQAQANFLLENCKLGSGYTPTTGTAQSAGGMTFKMHNCESTNTNIRFYQGNYLGSVQQSTSTVRSGGASNGTTPISWKIITTANTGATSNAAFGQPYSIEFLPVSLWENTTGSPVTITIDTAGTTTYTTGDIWIEVEYLGSASFPISTSLSTRPVDPLASTSNLSTSSDTWSGSPAVKQKLTATFTPNMAGPIKVRLNITKPSIDGSTVTLFVDPYMQGILTSGRQYLIPGGPFVMEGATGGGSSGTFGYASA